MRATLGFILTFFLFLQYCPDARSDTIRLAQSGGVAITTVVPNQAYSTTYGNVNGLGVGIPAAGVTAITSGVTGGTIYSSPMAATVTGTGANTSNIYVYLSSPFVHTTVTVMGCPSGAACNVGGSFATIPSSLPGGLLATLVANNSPVTFTIGVFLSNVNGATAFTGADTVTLRFRSVDVVDGSFDECTLTLSISAQSAVRLSLTSAGGLTIGPGAGTDYAVSFGNVNGLGISPTAGVTTDSVTGGYLYSTPYSILPQYSSQAATTSTVKLYVNSNFVNPAVLQLQDSATSASSSFIAIPTSVASAISVAAASDISLTRYLGLLVSDANGATAYSGPDSATIVYTLTVQ